MSDTAVRPTIYLKKTCPFSLKLFIFLTEAGLADRFERVVFADGDETHQKLRSRMEEQGVKPSFPAAEIAPGKLETGSDELIARFAEDAGVDPAGLPLLQYYSHGVFEKYGEMYGKLRDLADQQPEPPAPLAGV